MLNNSVGAFANGMKYALYFMPLKKISWIRILGMTGLPLLFFTLFIPEVPKESYYEYTYIRGAIFIISAVFQVVLSLADWCVRQIEKEGLRR